MQKPEIVILSDPAALAQEAARRFILMAQEAAAERGQFTAALAGGATPAGLYRLLATRPFVDQVPWLHTFVFFGDERCVPPDHPDSNYRMARETLLDRVPLPPSHVFRMAGEQPPHTAAQSYARILHRHFQLVGAARPRFDMIVLGMGDDGHTASLFPGMPALDERRRLVVGSEVPTYVRLAVPRVTLTLPVLNAGRSVLFLVAGASKAATVRDVLTGPIPDDPPPARRVQPIHGQLTWLLDTAASAGLRSA